MPKATYLQRLEQDTLASCGALDQTELNELGYKVAKREHFLAEQRREKQRKQNEENAARELRIKLAALEEEFNPKPPTTVIVDEPKREFHWPSLPPIASGMMSRLIFEPIKALVGIIAIGFVVTVLAMTPAQATSFSQTMYELIGAGAGAFKQGFEDGLTQSRDGVDSPTEPKPNTGGTR